jgi:NADH-quinone oxidoreductase subunit N
MHPRQRGSRVPIPDYLTLWPYVLVGLGGVLVLLVGALPGRWGERESFWVSLVVLVAAAVAIILIWGDTRGAVAGFAVIDPLGQIFGLLSIGGGLAAVLLARHYAPMAGEANEAFHSLVLFAVLGMLMLVSSASLLGAFLGLELVAIPLFALIAWQPGRRGAIEGGLKYAVLAGLAATFFLYGVALIYAGTGTLVPDAIAKVVAADQGLPELVLIGMALILVGVGFELALAPFHMWAPDIYQASPAPITALLATVAKVAVLVFVIRLFGFQLPTVWQEFVPLLWVLAAISMIVGNLLALRQENLKRLLAYSSIAHVGYIFMALASGTSLGLKAAIYYGLAYAIMNMCVFGVVSVVPEEQADREMLDSYRGVGRRHGALGVVMAVGLLSLAGLPPTAGFFAKLLALYAALEAGLIVLVIVAALSTAVSFYYYLRVLVAIYSPEPEAAPREPVPSGALLVLAASAILTVGLGLYLQLAWDIDATVLAGA